MPHRPACTPIEHIDRKRPFAVLAHIDIAAPIRGAPRGGARNPRPRVRRGIRIDTDPLLCAYGAVNLEVGARGIRGQRIAFAVQLLPDVVLRASRPSARQESPGVPAA
jgi:hypothetical protein